MRKTKTKTKKNAVALGGRLLRQRSETSSVTYARYVGTYSIYSTVSNQQSEQSPECSSPRTYLIVVFLSGIIGAL